MFCGAGGFDEGLRQALLELGYVSITEGGLDLLVINHWDVAIASQELNHPHARRSNDDVYKLSPRELVPGGYLDLLMASPTCTFFSRARGGKPLSWDQRKGRMTPQQVVRWCEDLTVKALIVENVPEFLHWGPICKSKGSCERHEWAAKKPGEFCSRPIREKRGKHFRWFLRELARLGYHYEYRILNAANYGDATTRERFFLIALLDPAAEIVWPGETHAERGSAPELFGVSKSEWRGAREIIDPKLRGRSIFKRKKPLAPKTLLRIYAGLIKFRWPLRFVLKLRLYMESLGIKVPDWPEGYLAGFPEAGVLVLRAHADMRSTRDPLPAVMAGGTHLGLIEPLLVPQGNDSPARGVSSPVPPVVTIPRTGLVEPFLFPANQGQERARGLRSTRDPLDTVVTRDMKALVEPFIAPFYGDAGGKPRASRGLDEPLATQPTSNRFGIVEPFVFGNRTNNVPKSVEEPIGGATTTTGGGFGLVSPFMLSQGAGGSPREISDPVPAIPTEGAHALVAPYYGTSDCKPVTEPLGTVTTRDRFGIVTPVTHHDTSDRSRSLDDPLPTVTTAARGELAFVTAAFGERQGQAARNRSVEQPVPTICAKGRVPLVQGITLADLDDVDILFRMLEPHELAAAMSFPAYYRFAGNKGEQTRQIGNAVPVRTAAALVAAVLKATRRAA